MKLDFEKFLERYEDRLYIEYMETGCYYEMEQEPFDEDIYELYLKGKWPR